MPVVLHALTLLALGLLARLLGGVVAVLVEVVAVEQILVHLLVVLVLIVFLLAVALEVVGVRGLPGLAADVAEVLPAASRRRAVHEVAAHGALHRPLAEGAHLGVQHDPADVGAPPS